MNDISHIFPALAAFWHRGRKVYVPLTGDELDRRAGTTLHQRADMVRVGLLVSGERVLRRSDRVYEISALGKSLLHRQQTAESSALRSEVG